jgi:hypothetical protein
VHAVNAIISTRMGNVDARDGFMSGRAHAPTTV